MSSLGLDWRFPGDVIEVDCEIEGEGGRWVRLAELYDKGQSGWMMIDGTKAGFGKLLEPMIDIGDAVKAEEEKDDQGPLIPLSSAAPSLSYLFEHAHLKEHAASYFERLREASDGVISDAKAPLACTKEGLTSYCKLAKLPIGARLGLINAWRAL